MHACYMFDRISGSERSPQVKETNDVTFYSNYVLVHYNARFALIKNIYSSASGTRVK